MVTRRWARRWSSTLASLQRATPVVVWAGLGVLLVSAGALLAVLADQAVLALPVLALPVVLAGVRFGVRAGVAMALAAGAIGGPAAGALGAGVSGAAMLATTVTLVIVGASVGGVAAPRLDQLARGQELTERERELAHKRAALVQVVSHELRTPLTVIRGGLDTLSTRPGAVAPDFQDLLRATARSTARLEELLGVVLAAADELGDGTSRDAGLDEPEIHVSGVVPPDARPVELWPVVRDAAASVRADLPERLSYHCPSDAAVVTVEPELWLTLRCLLDNAAKFGPDDEPIDVGFALAGGEAVVSIRDRGPGLPQGFEEDAFAPFTPGDTSLVRAHAGLGMGLYTARRLARRLGGDVEVVSPGDGLIARVRLPQPNRGARSGRSGDLERSSR